MTTTVGPAKVVLLPGFDGTGELFAPLQSSLGSNIPAIAVHYQHEHVFEEYVESVASLLPANDAVLVAESFSGPIALALMARYPARIRCAVLCATFAVSPFRSVARVARFVPAPFFGFTSIQAAMLRTFCFDEKTDPQLLAKTLSIARSIPAGTIKARLEMLANVDMRPLLPRINMPVLYLQATQDKVVGAHVSRQLISGLKNVTVRELKGPHLLLQCYPRECADAIKLFISSFAR